MILAPLFVSLGSLASLVQPSLEPRSLAPMSFAGGAPDIKWTAPKSPFIAGVAFNAHVDITAPKEGAAIDAWLLEPCGFTINGSPLGEKKDSHKLQLAPGAKLSLDVDLAPLISASKGFDGKPFKLGYGKGVVDAAEVDVSCPPMAEKGLSFMEMPVEDLTKYHVLLITNRGNMEVEFYPDVAPGHVRNFLDLSYTGFYDGTLFHRVGPGFMIQGGDPNTKTDQVQTWGSGNGPRMLKHEFSTKKHERGILSMARSTDLDSASCQFFIMHGTAAPLDGSYSVFGKLVNGYEALDAIVNSRGSRIDGSTVRPNEPQKIISAFVIKAGDKKDAPK